MPDADGRRMNVHADILDIAEYFDPFI